MKVYRLRNDLDHYQYFLPANGEPFVLEPDCKAKGATWTPPPVFIYEPLLEPGDFYQFSGGILITSPRATQVLRGFLEEAGELLPLPFEGQEYTVLNVTVCINCIDHERSTWLRNAQGGRIYPKQYVFHPDRFDESALFKIPDTHGGEILLVEGLRDPEDEFRAVVQRAGLQGLLFHELWRSEDEG